MKNGWSEVALSELMEQDRRYISDLEEILYKKLSVRLYGRGVTLDAPTDGATVKMDKHQLARAGQVIVSEIWAKKGAVGIVPDEGDGALVTSHFFLFDIQSKHVLPRWIRWLLAANYLEPQLSAGAFGSTGYAAVRPSTFLAARVPLPPIGEQRRLVDHLDAVEVNVARAQTLREEIAASSLALLRSLIHEDHCKGVQKVPLRELVSWRVPDIDVTETESYTFAGVYSFGRGVFRKEALSGMDFAYKRLTQLRTGEFVYPKLMAWEGALGVVPPECEGCYVSPEFPVFTVDESRVLPEILDIHFKTPTVWKALAALSPGTNLRRRRLNPKQFLEYRFPLPPMEAQLHAKQIATHTHRKRKLEADESKQMKSLLPSLLHHILS